MRAPRPGFVNGSDPLAVERPPWDVVANFREGRQGHPEGALRMTSKASVAVSPLHAREGSGDQATQDELESQRNKRRGQTPQQRGRIATGGLQQYAAGGRECQNPAIPFEIHDRLQLEGWPRRTNGFGLARQLPGISRTTSPTELSELWRVIVQPLFVASITFHLHLALQGRKTRSPYSRRVCRKRGPAGGNTTNPAECFIHARRVSGIAAAGLQGTAA